MNKNNFTAKIKLIGLRFFAFHGLYDFEKDQGNHFIVNVIIEKQFQNLISVELSQTVDYEIVFRIIEVEMQVRHELLENLALQILHKIESAFQDVKKIHIEIQKENPPIKNAEIKYSAVELVKEY